MSDFLFYLFFAIGFMATFFALGAAIVWAFEKSSELKRERDERHRELTRKLDDIEMHLKHRKDAI